MKSSFALRALLTICATSAAVPASARALQTDVVPVAVTEHSATLVGHADPSMHLRLEIVLPMHNLSRLRSLLDDQIYNPRSVLFRHYLTVPEFTGRFGPSQSDYDSAMRFFNANGLTVTRTFANRYMFQVDGAVQD